jgi:peptidoglycan/LPS O-acetylase OafA/YrhL
MNSAQHLLKQRTGYVPEIDGLRAIAVLSVILFHLAPSILPGGFSGVDVFFVISGYVVSGSLVREGQSTFLKFAANFYARRIVRIYPALVVCLVVVGLIQTLIVPPSWLSTTTNTTALFAFFGLSNFSLVWFSDGYFSPRMEFNAFTHTWSLGVEEQFYLLFPLVFFIWLKGQNRKNAVGVFAQWLLPVLLVASLIFSWHQTTAAPEHAYYRLPSRFWELACGAMLFKLQLRNQCIVRSTIVASACVATGLFLVGLGFLFSDPKSFPFPWAGLSVAGALLVIAGVVSDCEKGAAINRILDNRIMVYVGKMSYSLYLWHWPVLVMFRWTVGLETPLAIVGAILLTAFMSALSYHVVENPIRKSNLAFPKTDWHILSRGVPIIVLCCLFSAAVFKAQPYLSLSVTRDTHTWYPDSSDSDEISAVQQAFAKHKIFVLGDSHAGAYSAMFGKLTKEQGVEVRQYSKGGCSIANLLRQSDEECSRFTQQVVAKIEKEAALGDIVFLASLRMNRLSDQWDTFNESEVVAKQQSSGAYIQRALALQEADALIAKFEKASLRVVMDAPKPIFKSPPFRCSDWFNSENPVCKAGFTMERSFLSEYRRPVMESLVTLTRNHPNLVVWDLFSTLCGPENCSAFDEEKPLFFDGDHLSGHGNRVLYPSFLSLVTSVWR